MIFSSSIVCSLLILGLFLIDFALIPNLRVERVSYMLNCAGEQVTINVVRLLPPKEHCNILVNLESRYGTC